MGFDLATGSGMRAKDTMGMSQASSTLCRAIMFTITFNPAQAHVLQF